MSSVKANNLPILGDYSSSIISLSTEHSLGQAIIRNIRTTSAEIEDPIIESYIKDLTWSLIAASQLQDKRVSIVLLNSQSVNAFAAPGGVLGIHGGLIIAAQKEDELASVISHELAHLSQRHFAAQLEQQRLDTPLAIASMLTGLLVASSNAKAGTAIISTGAANQLSSRLAFSRRNEQEADRIGMLNLSKAGFKPQAMPRMFGRLLEIQRLQGSLPPEFLLTHPSSNARVADSQNRAEQLPIRKTNKENIDFSIIKARLVTKYAHQNKRSAKHFKTLAKKNPTPLNLYSLAIADAEAQSYSESIKTLHKLPSKWRNNLLVKLSLAQIYTKNRQYKKSLKILNKLNLLYPNHSAVQLIMAQTLLEAQLPKQAAEQLQHITSYDAENVNAWYLLAEAHGLAGNRNALHAARIEYFLLLGHIDAAKKQISFARKERSITKSDSYKLDELEEQLTVVKGYFETRY
ncbi:MAG: M48 family metalloprotease [Oceanospirillaceae bacterium]